MVRFFMDHKNNGKKVRFTREVARSPSLSQPWKKWPQSVTFLAMTGRGGGHLKGPFKWPPPRSITPMLLKNSKTYKLRMIQMIAIIATTSKDQMIQIHIFESLLKYFNEHNGPARAALPGHTVFNLAWNNDRPDSRQGGGIVTKGRPLRSRRIIYIYTHMRLDSCGRSQQPKSQQTGTKGRSKGKMNFSTQHVHFTSLYFTRNIW